MKTFLLKIKWDNAKHSLLLTMKTPYLCFSFSDISHLFSHFLNQHLFVCIHLSLYMHTILIMMQMWNFNINMCENNKYIVHENNTVSTKLTSADAKKYHQFCTMHGLKQLIQRFTRVTCSTSTLIDHISASFPSRVSQKFLKIFSLR